jgi:hypothetical protein
MYIDKSRKEIFYPLLSSPNQDSNWTRVNRKPGINHFVTLSILTGSPQRRGGAPGSSDYEKPIRNYHRLNVIIGILREIVGCRISTGRILDNCSSGCLKVILPKAWHRYQDAFIPGSRYGTNS